MRRHEYFEAMLARREELAPMEEAQLLAHVRSCGACRETATAFGHQDTAIRALRPVQPPTMLRDRVLNTITPLDSTPDTRLPCVKRPKNMSRRWQALMATVVVCFAALGVGLFLNQPAATPANAYTLLRQVTRATETQPYSGTAEISYTALDQYVLPNGAISRLGLHKIVTNWVVRDQHHFRIDVHTLSPAIDSGTLTAVLDGATLTTYDTRTQTAGVAQDPDPGLLAYLQTGATYGTPATTPNESIRHYVDSLKTTRVSGNIHPYARLAGQALVLGRRVNVVDFGPIAISCFSTRPNQPGCAEEHASGSARVWIDTHDGLIVKYQEFGLSDARSGSTDFTYEVTSLRVGKQPSSGALNYTPPVPAVPTIPLKLIWDIEQTDRSGSVPPGFLPAPPPRSYPGAPTVLEGVESRPTGPLNQTTAVNILFGQGQHERDGVPSGSPSGQPAPPYLSGGYLYIQERVQASGLPAVLRMGAPVAAGDCRVRTGRYSDGQHWLAFARGKISVSMTTNAMSDRDLIDYVAREVCR